MNGMVLGKTLKSSEMVLGELHSNPLPPCLLEGERRLCESQGVSLSLSRAFPRRCASPIAWEAASPEQKAECSSVRGGIQWKWAENESSA